MIDDLLKSYKCKLDLGCILLDCKVAVMAAILCYCISAYVNENHSKGRDIIQYFVGKYFGPEKTRLENKVREVLVEKYGLEIRDWFLCLRNNKC